MTTSEWCQRWSADGAMTWRYADPSEWFDDRWYEVHHIKHAVAVAYCEQRHYLRTFPADQVRFGLYHRGHLVGVAVYGVPTNVRVLTNWLPELVPYREAMAFQRLVLDPLVPGNGESWFMARCRELLTEIGVFGTVTFADPAQGHTGIVYQADNWTFCNQTDPSVAYDLRTGVSLDDRALSKVRGQESGHESIERALIAAGATPIRAGEHPGRYLRRALDETNATRRTRPGKYRYVRAHTPDVAIIHKGLRVIHNPDLYPKPSPDLLDLIQEMTRADHDTPSQKR